MKDLLNEEKIEQEIYRMAEIADDKKWKRVKRTFLVLCCVIYLAAFMLGEINGLKEYLRWLIVAPIMAGFAMLLSLAVLTYIVSGALEDEKSISRLRGKLDAIKLSKYNKE